MGWRLRTAWPSTPTCTAKKVRPPMPSTGTSVLGSSSAVPHSGRVAGVSRSVALRRRIEITDIHSLDSDRTVSSLSCYSLALLSGQGRHGFAMYQSKVEVIGSKLRYSREFVRRKVLIQPDRTEDLRELQGIIGADQVAAVVLKRAQ